MLSLLSISLIGSAPLLVGLGAAGLTTSLDRARAFEKVYSEGRWLHGADGATYALARKTSKPLYTCEQLS